MMKERKRRPKKTKSERLANTDGSEVKRDEVRLPVKAAMAVLWFQAVKSASEILEILSKFYLWAATKIQAWLLATSTGVSHAGFVVVAVVGTVGATYVYTTATTRRAEPAATVTMMPATRSPSVPILADAGTHVRGEPIVVDPAESDLIPASAPESPTLSLKPTNKRVIWPVRAKATGPATNDGSDRAKGASTPRSLGEIYDLIASPMLSRCAQGLTSIELTTEISLRAEGSVESAFVTATKWTSSDRTRADQKALQCAQCFANGLVRIEAFPQLSGPYNVEWTLSYTQQ